MASLLSLYGLSEEKDASQVVGLEGVAAEPSAEAFPESSQYKAEIPPTSEAGEENAREGTPPVEPECVLVHKKPPMVINASVNTKTPGRQFGTRTALAVSDDVEVQQEVEAPVMPFTVEAPVMPLTVQHPASHAETVDEKALEERLALAQEAINDVMEQQDRILQGGIQAFQSKAARALHLRAQARQAESDSNTIEALLIELQGYRHKIERIHARIADLIAERPIPTFSEKSDQFPSSVTPAPPENLSDDAIQEVLWALVANENETHVQVPEATATPPPAVAPSRPPRPAQSLPQHPARAAISAIKRVAPAGIRPSPLRKF